MKLNFATLSSPLQKTGGHGGTQGTPNIHAGLSRTTLSADAWDTVGQAPGPVVKWQDEGGHLSHLSHLEQNEVGQAEPSIHGAVPLVPPVPPLSESNATADPDWHCWPHTEAMNTAEIDTFTGRLHRFTRHGLDFTQAEQLADSLVQRDRGNDDRRLCLECVHLQHGAGLWGCNQWRRAGLGAASVAGDLVTVLQRCEGFKNGTVPQSAKPGYAS